MEGKRTREVGGGEINTIYVIYKAHQLNERYFQTQIPYIVTLSGFLSTRTKVHYIMNSK
jgi:hypothetical protein